jgi:hypothetical protein
MRPKFAGLKARRANRGKQRRARREQRYLRAQEGRKKEAKHLAPWGNSPWGNGG